MSTIPQSLREFIDILEKNNQLYRIKVSVSHILEISEITDRIVKSKNSKGLFFENVENFKIPIAINLFGSERNLCLAFGINSVDELQQKTQRLLQLLKTPPQSLWDKVKKGFEFLEISKYLPKIVSKGRCQEVVLKGEEINLYKFPIMKCWPEDASQYITFPIVFTKDPHTQQRNVGLYRMQVLSKDTLCMHWQRHKGGKEHSLKYKDKIPVAVAIGCSPAVSLAGALPIPDFDELIFAGLLQESPVELVKCITIPELEVPANAEIVLEGYVDINNLVLEGPFGDHTGFYSLPEPFPVFTLTAITHRKEPIYHSIIVGKPPMEDDYLGLAIEKLTLPFIRMLLPEVTDVHFPFEGIFHNLVLVSIKKKYPGHARKVMHAIWGMGLAMLSKIIVVFDDDVNLRNYSEVVWKGLCSIDPERDFELAEGPVDDLDFASKFPAYGSKVGIDCTKKLPEEGFTRIWPREITMSEDIKNLVTQKWREYGF
ncbi:MAG: menaquinone biosynthesis decarboxylase [Planctomycetota bacterium]